jgi:hypothetical protein
MQKSQSYAIPKGEKKRKSLSFYTVFDVLGGNLYI